MEGVEESQISLLPLSLVVGLSLLALMPLVSVLSMVSVLLLWAYEDFLLIPLENKNELPIWIGVSLCVLKLLCRGMALSKYVEVADTRRINSKMGENLGSRGKQKGGMLMFRRFSSKKYAKES